VTNYFVDTGFFMLHAKRVLSIAFSQVSLSTLIYINSLIAQPDLSSGRMINSIQIFNDINSPTRYYYTPGKLVIARSTDGKPDFKFVRTRYTGTYLGSDQGGSRFRSALFFRVVMENRGQKIIDELKTILRKENQQIEIRPLPIKHLQAIVNDPLSNAEADSIHDMRQGAGDFYAPSSKGYSNRSEFWTERDFSLNLDDASSQLLWGALQKRQVIISVSYAFLADMAVRDISKFEYKGSADWIQTFKQGVVDSTNKKDSQMIYDYPVLADAFNIEVDLDRWPDLCKQVDINSGVPPDYAALAVYCYDFQNDLRPDLYARRIEIEAEGVSGSIVKVNVTFQRSQQDLYHHRVRFPYAVRIDRPFRYRIVNIGEENGNHVSAWKVINSWTSIIDITSKVYNLEEAKPEEVE